MILIPAGYRIEVLTSENDGDNYKTNVESGLTIDKLCLIAGLVKIMEKYGNEETDNEDVSLECVRFARKVESLIPEAFRDIISGSLKDRSDEEVFGLLWDEILYDLVDSWNDGDMYRCVDKISIHYFEDDVEATEVDIKVLLATVGAE